MKKTLKWALAWGKKSPGFIENLHSIYTNHLTNHPSSQMKYSAKINRDEIKCKPHPSPSYEFSDREYK